MSRNRGASLKKIVGLEFGEISKTDRLDFLGFVIIDPLHILLHSLYQYLCKVDGTTRTASFCARGA